MRDCTLAESARIGSGVNANGSYTKFPDGTMICWRSGINNNLTWTFPHAFISEPVVTGNALQPLNRVVAFGTPTNTSVSVVAFRGEDPNNPTSVSINLLAVGRWK